MRLASLTDADAYVQAAREAFTALEPAYSEAQAHLQESLAIQNDVILQVDLHVDCNADMLLNHSTCFWLATHGSQQCAYGAMYTMPLGAEAQTACLMDRQHLHLNTQHC